MGLGKDSETRTVTIPSPLSEQEVRLRDILMDELLGPSSSLSSVASMLSLDRMGGLDQPAKMDPRMEALIGQFGPQLFATPRIMFDLMNAVKDPLGTVQSDFFDYSPASSSGGRGASGPPLPTLPDTLTAGEQAAGAVLHPPAPAGGDNPIAALIAEAKQKLLTQMRARITPPSPDAPPGAPAAGPAVGSGGAGVTIPTMRFPGFQAR